MLDFFIFLSLKGFRQLSQVYQCLKFAKVDQSRLCYGTFCVLAVASALSFFEKEKQYLEWVCYVNFCLQIVDIMTKFLPLVISLLLDNNSPHNNGTEPVELPESFWNMVKSDPACQSIFSFYINHFLINNKRCVIILNMFDKNKKHYDSQRSQNSFHNNL